MNRFLKTFFRPAEIIFGLLQYRGKILVVSLFFLVPIGILHSYAVFQMYKIISRASSELGGTFNWERNIVMGLVVVSLCFAFYLVVAFSRIFNRNVRALAQSALALKNGGMSPVILSGKNDELARVVQQFSEVAVQLRAEIIVAKHYGEILGHLNTCIMNLDENPVSNIYHLVTQYRNLLGAHETTYCRIEDGQMEVLAHSGPNDKLPAIERREDLKCCLKLICEDPTGVKLVRTTKPEFSEYNGRSQLMTVCHAVYSLGKLAGVLCVVMSEKRELADVQCRLMAVMASAIGVQEERFIKQSEVDRMQSLLDNIIKNVHAPIYVKRLNGVYLLVNQEFCRVIRVTREQVIGQTDFDLMPDDKALEFRRNDELVVKKGEPIEFEEAVLQDDGLHTYVSLKFPLIDGEGEIFATCGVSTDITERLKSDHDLKENNKRLAEALAQIQDDKNKLIQSEKLSSLGRLAAGVAHEINNPLGYVMSNVSTLADYVKIYRGAIKDYESAQVKSETGASIRSARDLDFVDSDLDALLHEVGEGLTRVKEIVQQLKTFVRSDDASFVDVDINAGIEATLKMVWNELKYKCRLEKDLGYVPKVLGSAGQLNQVFLNLLVNASHAIAESGTITITSGVTGMGEVFLSVSDTGVGISEEDAAKLFTPFFTTKKIGKGTGLGLSISYGIIKNHGGRIEVKSKLGVGTTFTVFLPPSASLEQNIVDTAASI